MKSKTMKAYSALNNDMCSGAGASSVKKCQTSGEEYRSFFSLLISYIQSLAVYYIPLSKVRILIYEGFSLAHGVICCGIN